MPDTEITADHQADIRLALVVLITSTSRLLTSADDLRRQRDHLLRLLDQATPDDSAGDSAR